MDYKVISESGKEYVRITNSETIMFLVGEVAEKDQTNETVVGHDVGMELSLFSDVIGLGGTAVNALPSSVSSELPPVTPE